MNFQVGQELEFSIFGTIVKGTFVKCADIADGVVTIMTTYDSVIPEEIGKEQDINLDYLIIKN